MKKCILILAALCVPLFASAEASPAPAPKAITATTADPLTPLHIAPDPKIAELEKQVADLQSIAQSLQTQRNQVASQLLDAQLQLELANKKIAELTKAPPTK